MAHKIFTYDTSKTTGGRNTNKAAMMIRQTELNLLENKKQAPFTGYSANTGILKESFTSTRVGENSVNESFNIGKFVSHQDLEQRDKVLTKFIQEAVSKQITTAIEKFKTHNLKDILDKSMESQKEEFESLRKLIKTNEEMIKELQSEKLNYEQTLNKIEIVLERQFASATAAGSFVSFKEDKPSNEVALQLKEEIKNIQINVKNLKETILNQISEQLTQGLSSLALEQEKIQDSIKRISQNNNHPSSETIEKLKKFEETVNDFEKKIEKYNSAVTEQKHKNDAYESRIEELLKILKSDKKEGIAFEASNLADSERIHALEVRLDNCLAELLKTNEKFEESLAKKLDSSIFEVFKLEACEIEYNVEKKPIIDSVYIVKEQEEKKEVIQENVEEHHMEHEKNAIIDTTPLKEFPREENISEKKETDYEDWLAKNKEMVEGKSPEKFENSNLKKILEGDESKISEIKVKEEDFNSEIQRDFESINKEMEKNLKVEEKNDEIGTPDKRIEMKNQGSASVENDDDAEVVYNIDEQGYLIDDNGNYILDDDGKMLKLSPEHIEYLRESNMYEEEFTTK